MGSNRLRVSRLRPSRFSWRSPRPRLRRARSARSRSSSSHSSLAPALGSWHVSSSFGRVWHPRECRRVGWHPYTRGPLALHRSAAGPGSRPTHWGAIPFHYGTWVIEPGLGSVWVPGYAWAPAWGSSTGPGPATSAGRPSRPVLLGRHVVRRLRPPLLRRLRLRPRPLRVRAPGRLLPASPTSTAHAAPGRAHARCSTTTRRSSTTTSRSTTTSIVNRGPDVRRIERAVGATGRSADADRTTCRGIAPVGAREPRAAAQESATRSAARRSAPVRGRLGTRRDRGRQTAARRSRTRWVASQHRGGAGPGARDRAKPRAGRRAARPGRARERSPAASRGDDRG